ncbi:hypothetical protein M9H77_16628 [Catharanthus roseus]|uniref:Uncharacterized protein n=1 Tax=Catharanthus roseus TaxID=4058 RepID=A0ACC0B2A7_CATRO|nr:hypothetical protein M9H77_16628 [Catharanthus roseus]
MALKFITYSAITACLGCAITYFDNPCCFEIDDYSMAAANDFIDDDVDPTAQRGRIEAPSSMCISPRFVEELEEEECCICLLSWKEDEDECSSSKWVVIENCQHRFHDHCIKDWFEINQTCPLCRRGSS